MINVSPIPTAHVEWRAESKRVTRVVEYMLTDNPPEYMWCLTEVLLLIHCYAAAQMKQFACTRLRPRNRKKLQP